ncbi:EpsG family protein [Coprobacillaceae bacterium CR2/5/TPMF4]|nr:EpsG family protein [Coprobacillaceae bacterium CR2/5/TPMF4]
MIAAVLAIFVGLRISYNDTYTYMNMYEALSPGISNLLTIDLNIGSNPGFWVVNTIIKTIGFSTQSFLMVYAIATVGIYLWFIRKYSDNIWLSVFYFSLWVVIPLQWQQ